MSGVSRWSKALPSKRAGHAALRFLRARERTANDIKHFLHRDDVLRELRKYVSDYGKGMAGVFDRTEPFLSVATTRTGVLKQIFERIPGEDPYTDVHERVQLLLGLIEA
jgi:hypothetical protein